MHSLKGDEEGCANTQLISSSNQGTPQQYKSNPRRDSFPLPDNKLITATIRGLLSEDQNKLNKKAKIIY